MKVLIVDDEALARAHLQRLLEEIGAPYELAGTAANGAQAVEACASTPVDLVLMDIQMPGIDGLEAAVRMTQRETPPAIVFTTAYDEYVLRAFEIHALDYLLKPVRRERLEKALGRARKLTRPQLQQLDALQGRSPEPEFVYAHSRGGERRILLEEILFFRAEQKYVVVRHQEGESLLEESLKSLEQRFGRQFLRIHRNALVAKGSFAGLRKGGDGRFLVQLAGTEECLEISRRHLPEVRRWLKGD